ncbi:hypothetical protein ACSNN9_26220 [Micromonospora sp. URMC 107]|uniref:hypothetical protein n=1 Tax=Micromonospora sp. URMC 107 TaxID=3423418 RepID=UPI003F198144
MAGRRRSPNSQENPTTPDGTGPPPRASGRDEEAGKEQREVAARAPVPDPPESSSNEQPDEPPARPTRRGLLLAAGGAAVTAIIGGVIGAIISDGANRLTSSGQAVRDERAVDKARRASARQKPPISANAYYYHRSTEAVAWLFPQQLTADQKRQLLTPEQPPTTGVPEALKGGIHAVVGGTRQHPNRLLTRIRVSTVGQWTEPVFVTQMRAKVLRRTLPPAGAYLFQGSQGGEAPLEIGFDLDEPGSVARVVKRDGGTLGEAYLDRHSLTFSQNEPLTIDVQAHTDQSYCEWVIELDLDLGGEKRTLTVDDDGRSFRSTALARHYEERYYVKLTGGWTAKGAGPPIFDI